MSARWPFGWSQVRAVLVRVLMVLLVLELVYVVVANSVLKSSLIKKAVGSSEGMYLDYGSVFSWLPGRARVADLTLRIEDYNVQFELKIERAELEVGLDELIHKRFHVFRLRADGVSFRMRHKVKEAAGHGERLAAFPKIAGFADPPLFVGPEPPPIPDEQYDLWQVQIDDVVAHAKELWFLEYRFQGDAEARGAFLVRPARLVKVEPARLELRSGRLTLGTHVVAGNVTGNVSVSLPHLDVPKVEGIAVLHEISMQARVKLERGGLDFIDAYREQGDPSVRGAADWSIEARLKRGVVQPGTAMAARASALEVTIPSGDRPGLTLSGPTELGIEVSQAAPNRIGVSASAAAIELNRLESDKPPKLPSPTLDQVSVAASIGPADLTESLRLVSLRARLGRAQFPNLYWLQPWLSRDGSVRVDGAGDANFEAACNEQRVCEVERARVYVVGARLALGERSSQPLSGSFSAEHVLVPWQDEKLAGQARLELSSARALLPLVTSLPIKDAISSALGLERLQARFSLAGTVADYRVRLLEARSGGFSARGNYRRHQQHEEAALLMSTGAFNVGVTRRDGEQDISLLVGDDWLTRDGHGG